MLGKGPGFTRASDCSVEAIMPNQTRPGPGDIADERGKFTPSESPIAPDGGIDEAGIDRSSGDTPHNGDQGPAIEGLADPDADANFPEPSKAISMR
jgi:hypothetical protein